MTRNRALIIVAALIVVAGGVFFLVRGSGGQGQQVTLSVTVKGTTMEPEQLVVKQNDQVTMTVTTDRDEEIHLHGYDISLQARAGQPVTRTFRADKTGSFDIEIEDLKKEIGSLKVEPR